MHVQEPLVKATHEDLDPAPVPSMGKTQPDEFDVDAYNVGAFIAISSSGLFQRYFLICYPHTFSYPVMSLALSVCLSVLSYVSCPRSKSTCTGPIYFQSNKRLWEKWDDFHKNVSPGGAWHCHEWCRHYVNVRASIHVHMGIYVQVCMHSL